MNDLFRQRILPYLLVVHMAVGIILTTTVGMRIDSESQAEMRQILDYHAEYFGKLYRVAPASPEEPRYADPQLASNHLMPGMEATGERRFVPVTRVYLLEDVLNARGSLSDLPEIAMALQEGSGFSVRRAGRASIYRSALRLDDAEPAILIHAAIGQDRDMRLKSFASVLIVLVLAGSFTVLSAASIALIRAIGADLSRIAEGIGQYAEGQLKYEVAISRPGILQNITRKMELMAERHRERIEELTRQRHELESILSTMQEGILLISSSEKILMINASAATMFGIGEPPESLTGSTIADSLRSSELHQAVERLVESARGIRERIQVYDRSREQYRILDLTGLYIDPAHLPDARILLVLHDISDLMRLEQVRRDFVSNVSHELKTPITTIQGFAETLAGGALEDPAVARDFLNIITKQSHRMESIITDLLTLSRLEQQGSELQRREFDLEEMLKDVIDVCFSAADEKRINIHQSITGGTGAYVNANLLEQAIINLVENAIKYGTAGGDVWVNIENDRDSLVIIVRDNGPGIPRRDLPRLFERFYRVDKGRSSSMGGTGLGLAIVKHIAGAHGGNVRVESVVGQGSSFTMTLPCVNRPGEGATEPRR
jgi:two-component system phosphate regulon sensor histidine kinase PhoR